MTKTLWTAVLAGASLLLTTALAAPLTAQPAPPASSANRPAAATAGDNAAVQKELLAITRELLASVATGKGKEVWDRYLLPECLIADSSGQISSRDEVVAQFPTQPAPPGKYDVDNPVARVNGDVAVLSYDLTEHQDVFGQAIAQRFHATDTYVHRDGIWRILSSQGTQLAVEPPVGRAHPESYAAYVGTYRIGPDITYTVTRDGDHLYGERKGQPKEELLPETPDVFFRRGLPGRRIFDRDASGKVTRMLDRKEGQDLVWARVETK
ncbi:MAG TPA: DUF4440 domain-containing protein [Thermoanaerobaculia bacterium]